MIALYLIPIIATFGITYLMFGLPINRKADPIVTAICINVIWIVIVIVIASAA